MFITIQATTSDHRSQITTLQAALEGARKENAARKEHEAKLICQFQVCFCCSVEGVSHLMYELLNKSTWNLIVSQDK